MQHSFLEHTSGACAPLRIVQVVNVRWFNATAWYGLFLSRILREHGHQVCVLGLKDTESFARAEEWNLDPRPMPLNTATPLGMATLGANMRKLIHTFRPHIVNCHRGESFLLWAMMKTGKNPFALVRTRGDQRPPKANLVNAFLHGRIADAVIATSSSIADGLKERLRVPSGKLHTIFGGVDTRVFAPAPGEALALRESLKVPSHVKLIGLIGRFDTVKGQKELIGAYAKMLARMDGRLPDTRLVLAGFSTSALEERTVRQWVADAGITDKTIFTGRVHNVAALMSALDIGVVASLGSETIARVALEIMACGTPLVGTRVGVMPDLLSPEALVGPGNEEETAAILERFLTDEAFAASLREEQAARIRTLTERDFYAQTMTAYRQAMNIAAGFRE